jgi:hypothetical protein
MNKAVSGDTVPVERLTMVTAGRAAITAFSAAKRDASITLL